MDINFNISEIHNYLTYSNNVLENINFSFNQMQNLFSKTQGETENIKTKIKETSNLIRQYLEKVNLLKNYVNSEISRIPENKELKEKPKAQAINGNLNEIEAKLKDYEKTCKDINKENEKIETENKKNNQRKETLQNMDNEYEKILQRLEILKSRCDYLNNFLDETNSKLLNQKQQNEFQFRNALDLASQNNKAINNTYNFAQPLVEESKYSRVYGNLHNIFKLKPKNNGEFMAEEPKNEIIFENKDKKNEANEKKIITLNSRYIDELLEELNQYKLNKGDIVKVPSYNLYFLGNSKLFETMNEQGFELIKKVSASILEDGTFSWEKL